MRVRHALAAVSLLFVACNALTGVGSLAVDTPEDAASPVVEAGPAPTVAPTTTMTPPSPTIDAGSPDAGFDAALPPNIGTFNGHRYEVVVGDAISWSDAKKDSASKGGHLVTITTAAENVFVAQLVAANGGAPNDNGPWFGASKPQGTAGPDGAPPDPNAGWAWITGEVWSYTSWGSEQPDNDNGDENYLGGLGDPKDGFWNDWRVGGDGDVLSYVIEYEP